MRCAVGGQYKKRIEPEAQGGIHLNAQALAHAPDIWLVA
jgi:hypothetical protein